MCTKGRDVIDTSLWLAPTRNSWFTGNNCKPRSLPRIGFSGLPVPLGKGEHVDLFSVARVRPYLSRIKIARNCRPAECQVRPFCQFLQMTNMRFSETFHDGETHIYITQHIYTVRVYIIHYAIDLLRKIQSSNCSDSPPRAHTYFFFQEKNSPGFIHSLSSKLIYFSIWNSIKI